MRPTSLLVHVDRFKPLLHPHVELLYDSRYGWLRGRLFLVCEHFGFSFQVSVWPSSLFRPECGSRGNNVDISDPLSFPLNWLMDALFSLDHKSCGAVAPRSSLQFGDKRSLGPYMSCEQRHRFCPRHPSSFPVVSKTSSYLPVAMEMMATAPHPWIVESCFKVTKFSEIECQ